jgi:hypothetical protein
MSFSLFWAGQNGSYPITLGMQSVVPLSPLLLSFMFFISSYFLVIRAVTYLTVSVSNLLKTATLLLEKGASILKTHVSQFSFSTSQKLQPLTRFQCRDKKQHCIGQAAVTIQKWSVCYSNIVQSCASTIPMIEERVLLIWPSLKMWKSYWEVCSKQYFSLSKISSFEHNKSITFRLFLW